MIQLVYLTNLIYQRDHIGNITQIDDTNRGKVTAYSYDSLYRLSNADSTEDTEDRSYTYDKVGNRKTETNVGVTYFHNHTAGNRLTDIRTGSPSGALYRQFEHDDAGRITEKRNGSGDALYSVSHNGKGRASQIQVGADTQAYRYDANDYRINKDNKLYYLEGEHTEAIYDDNNNLQDKYLRGVIIDEIVNSFHYNDAGNSNDWDNYTYHHDHLNSVTAQTGHAGGTEQTWSYDAFGNITDTEATGTGNELLYTGRNYDVQTGLYYYRARYYDPEMGRFLSEDPIGFAAGINFYAYVSNNPVNFNDPSGNADVPSQCPGCYPEGVTQNGTFLIGGSVAIAPFKIPIPFTDKVLQPAITHISGGVAATVGDLPLQVGVYNTVGVPVSQVVDGYPFPTALELFRLTLDIGFSEGDINDLQGLDGNVFLGYGPLGGTFSQDLNRDDLQGGVVSFGPQVRAGASLDFTSAVGWDFSANQPIVPIFLEDVLSSSGTNSSAIGGFEIYPNSLSFNMINSVYQKRRH